MTLKCTISPAAEPVSLELARAQCRVDSTDEDALLSLYIQGAREAAESITNRALITQTWEQTLDRFPAAEIKLLKPQVLSIVRVQYLDTDGALQTLDPSRYALDPRELPGYLFPAEGTDWPSTADVIDAVTITFTAGFGPTAEDVPAGIRHWMLLHIAADFETRAAVDATGRTKALPDRYVDGKLDQWVVYGL